MVESLGTLYHYSSIAIDVVLSSAEQQRRGLLPPRPGGGAYFDDISVFFAPVPLDVIGGQFPADHPAWAPGKTIYVSEIEVSAVDSRVETLVVETPAETELADRYWGKLPEEDYRRREAELIKRNHLRGTGLVFLAQQVKRWGPLTRPCYQALINRPDFKGDLDGYYAACVPHGRLTAPVHALPIARQRKLVVPLHKK